MENFNYATLTQVEKDGLELYIDTQTGEVFATSEAIAKLCNYHDGDVRDYLRLGKMAKTAKRLILRDSNGFDRTVTLYGEESIHIAISRYSPELTQIKTLSDLRSYLYLKVGYIPTVKPSNSRSALDYFEAIRYLNQEIQDSELRDLLMDAIKRELRNL